ncbi:MAG: hypothetical protein ACJ76Y_13790 [Thermoanaerobaculia bacterium]
MIDKVRYLPLLLASVVVTLGIAYYPFADDTSNILRWPATRSYLLTDFQREGFSIECRSEPTPSCGVIWQGEGTTSSGSVVQVYECDSDAMENREAILARFADNAEPLHDLEGVSRSMSVLDGFFQSGLRRTCDRVVRTAREAGTLIGASAPFKLEASSRRPNLMVVKNLDESYGLILAGLPERPSYRGDFVAFAASGLMGNPAEEMSNLTLISNEGASTALLDPNGGETFRPVWPGAQGVIACRSVALHPCNPNDGDDECKIPVAQFYALPKGRALVRVGGNKAERLASGNRDSLMEDELLLLDGKGYLSVYGTVRHPGFTLEFSGGMMRPVSRVRLVNGRWERWYEPSFRSWLKPVNDSYVSLAHDNKIPPEARVALTIDMDLQRKLEAGLSNWMQENLEPEVRRHMRDAHYKASKHSLNILEGETEHRRAVPHAGVTVLDPATGALLAIASYPPAEALVWDHGTPMFGQGWQERLVGPHAPTWAASNVLSLLDSRLNDETNSNFIAHPIGSTFKPLLLSSFIDRNTPSGSTDGLDPLFDLMITGHLGTDGGYNGGNSKLPLRCSGPSGRYCTDRSAEAIAGMPAGPWGSEEGTRHGGPWIDRWEFLIDSCNKYAVTLGTLSLLDWKKNGLGNASACCWNRPRDEFGFVAGQSFRMTGEPAGSSLYVSTDQLPPLGPWAQVINGSLSPTAYLADAPLFVRLFDYYDVSPRSSSVPFDSAPWLNCEGLAKLDLHDRNTEVVGRVAGTQLHLTTQPASITFTNLFTGAGHNWWSNVELAQAYGRLMVNQKIRASFCRPEETKGELFKSQSRQHELIKMLSLQRQASWVKVPKIDSWQKEKPDKRITLSKTGTTLWHEGYKNTGIFVIFLGSAADKDILDRLPVKPGKGLLVLAYVDEAGSSENVTKLVDYLFDDMQSTYLGRKVLND